jgi:hypothetical protein
LGHSAIMAAHSRATLERMLPEATSFATRGAELVREQEARVVALQHNEALAEDAKTLLAIMRDTQELHVYHIAHLRQELGLAEFAPFAAARLCRIGCNLTPISSVPGVDACL